jgi:Nucleotidyl transferase AbiEii toxin, Type IV TA system
MSPPTFVERIQLIDGALADLPHAFGGALALAYYAEPRTTVDIDVNIFTPPANFDQVIIRLDRIGLDAGAAETRELIRRDGQARVFWDDVPVDMFLSYDAFHHAAAIARRQVPFAGGTIDVLSPEHLMVCKVVFNRPKDWIDIIAMLDGDEVVDAAEVFRWVARIVGDEDGRYVRVVEMLSHP